MRSRLTLLGAAIFTTTVWAQDAIVRPAAPAVTALRLPLPGPTRGTRQDVIARVLSFDADRDGKVTKGELNERMQHLLAAGDSNRDGALDASEIGAIVTGPNPGDRSAFATTGPVVANRPAVIPRFSARRPPLPLGIEGVLSDLKLPVERREAAFAAAAQHNAAVAEATRRSVQRLMDELRELLTPEQHAALNAVARQTGTSFQIGANRVIFSSPRERSIEQWVEGFQLAAEAKTRVDAAVKAHSERVLAILSDDSGLKSRLQGVLTAEELADFTAAFNRQGPSAIVGGPSFVGTVGGVTIALPPPPPPPPPGR